MAVLGLVAWKRPLLGGILLAVLAILLTIYFLTFNDFFSTALVGMLTLCAPVVIAGFLFIESDWASKKDLISIRKLWENRILSVGGKAAHTQNANFS